MDKRLLDVLVLGGGSAGWLVAAAGREEELAEALGEPDVDPESFVLAHALSVKATPSVAMTVVRSL